MRRSLRYSPTTRRGFTLVELLVACALSILIMAIMATGFSIALDTLSQLKSVATLMEDERSAETIIRRDLKSQHLEDENGASVRVSDPQVMAASWAGNDKRGFFRVRQGSPVRQNTSLGITVATAAYPSYVPNPPELRGPNYPYLLEGYDSDGTPNYRATDHSLQFTVKLSGKTPQDVFSAKNPIHPTAPPSLPPTLALPPMASLVDQNSDATMFVSRWAEVAYFLKPARISPASPPAHTIVEPGSTLPELTLYTLYRRQRLISPVDASYTVANPQASFVDINPDISFVAQPPNAAFVNTPTLITVPGSRLNLNVPTALLPSLAFGSPGYGTDILLTNVISMQIRLTQDPVPSFMDDATNPSPTAPVPSNPLDGRWQYDTAEPNPRAVSPSIPPTPKPRPRSIVIKLRVYEPKNKLTRQITITQDL